MTYEVMTHQCGRSVVQVLVVSMDIGLVTYESMTSQCGRSVFKVLNIGMDITLSAVACEPWFPDVGGCCKPKSLKLTRKCIKNKYLPAINQANMKQSTTDSRGFGLAFCESSSSL